MDTIPAPAPVAPSAPPAAPVVPAPVAPSTPAPATPAAPVAAAPAVPEAMPSSEADMIAFASKSLQVPDTRQPAAPESPAAIVAPVAPVALPPPANVPAAPAVPVVAADDDAEPSAEVMATLGEPGKRALQAEREKRKEAKTQLSAANAEIERLKTLIPPPAPAPGAPAPGEPSTPAPVAPSAPVVPALAACKNSAEVDACVMDAIQKQGLAMELNTVLNTQGFDAVVQRFQASNLDNFRGIPLNELTPAILAREFAQTNQQAEEIKLIAPQQRQVLSAERENMLQAVNLVPGLKDPNGELRKAFNALANNPAVRALGPEWPVHVAYTLLGRQASRQTPAPAIVAPLPATPLPPVVPAPGAPSRSVQPAATPTPADDAAARLANGTATEKDMKTLAAGSLRVGGTR